MDNTSLIELMNSVVPQLEGEPRQVVACYGKVEEGKYTRVGHHHCHGGLNEPPNINKEKCQFIVTVAQYDRDNYDEELALKWYDWLLNRSPWSSVYISSGPKQMLDCVGHNIDVPANLMLGSCIAYRTVTENPDWVKNWGALVDAGLEENLALVFMHNFIVHSKSTFSVKNTAIYLSHEPFSANPSVGMINNFLEGNLVKPNHNYRERLGYSHVNQLWGSSDASLLTNITTKVKEVLDSTGSSKVVDTSHLNIFEWFNKQKAANGTSKSYPLERLTEAVAVVRQELKARGVKLDG